MSVIEEIAAERKRQIEVEGWTPEHDDQHDGGEMLRAAVHYLWHGTDKGAPIEANGAPLGWPWEPEWWKPKDRRRNLVRAGALCHAERDRILRSGGKYVAHVDQKLQIIISEIERLDRAPGGPGEGEQGEDWTRFDEQTRTHGEQRAANIIALRLCAISDDLDECDRPFDFHAAAAGILSKLKENGFYLRRDAVTGSAPLNEDPARAKGATVPWPKQGPEAAPGIVKGSEAAPDHIGDANQMIQHPHARPVQDDLVEELRVKARSQALRAEGLVGSDMCEWEGADRIVQLMAEVAKLKKDAERNKADSADVAATYQEQEAEIDLLTAEVEQLREDMVYRADLIVNLDAQITRLQDREGRLREVLGAIAEMDGLPGGLTLFASAALLSTEATDEGGT